MFNAIRFANRLEFFLIPACFVLGVISNLTGSLAILSSYQMRKRTPLFIIACIGIVDSLFLLTQAQRWFAINFSNKHYLSNHSMCKLYFTLTRSSLLITVSLLFCMLLSRFVRIFYGLFRLSVYSNMGQLLSKLSVAYVFALGLALSWHELWTSGVQYDSTESQLNILLNEKTKLSCRKNVLSFFVIETFEVVYFVITSSISTLLIVLSAMMIIKIKRMQLFKSCFFFNTNSRSERFSFNDLEPNSLFNNFSSSDCNELNDKKETTSCNNLNTGICVVKPQKSAENVNELKVASSNISKFKSFDHLNLNISTAAISTNQLKFSLPNLTASHSKCNSLLSMNQKPIKPSVTTDFIVKFRITSCEPNTNSLSGIKAHNRTTKFHLNSICIEKAINDRNRFFRFSSFLISTSLFCGFFYLAYFFSDYFYYENAITSQIYDKDKFLIYNQSLNAVYQLYLNYYIKFDTSNLNIMNQTLVNYRARLKYEESLIAALFPNAMARLPLILINIPHAIKFGFLFLFYSKYRHRLSYLLKMRLFVNWEIAKRLFCDKNIKLKLRKKSRVESKEKTRSETKRTSVLMSSMSDNEQHVLKIIECKETDDEKHSVKKQQVGRNRMSDKRPRGTNIRMKKRINCFNCFQVPSSEAEKKKQKKPLAFVAQTKRETNEESPNNKKSLLMRALKRYGSGSTRRKAQRLNMLTRYNSEELLETSSIVGYKSSVTNNKRLINEDLYDFQNIFMSNLKLNQKSSFT